MTKKRKSIVEHEQSTKHSIGKQQAFLMERILPTPQETAETVQKLTGKADQADAEKRGPGRPKKDHDRDRFTTIIEKDLRAKIKIIAAREDRQIHDVFNEAVAQYVDQYEKERGKIDL
jgi:hypothetical protein